MERAVTLCPIGSRREAARCRGLNVVRVMTRPEGLIWQDAGGQGALFDCDGVLVDSDASVERAWRRWTDEYGLPVHQVLDMAHGRRSGDTVGLLIPGPGRAAAQHLIDALELADAATIAEVPGAGALLRGMPPGRWAVVTSGVRALALARLAGAGLPEPAVLIPAEDVAEGKPAPDGYLAAAARLGFPPDQTIVIEDSAAGIAAGRAAGAATVIGVGERARSARPDFVVQDLRQIRWRQGRLEVACPAGPSPR